VSDLSKFLQYLDRADVSEIVFQSGATASAKQRGKLKPVTREPLTAQHILKLVRDTPLEDLVPRADGSSAPLKTRMGTGRYVAMMSKSGAQLMLRVRRDESVSPAAEVPAIGSMNKAISDEPPANRVLDAGPAEHALPHDIMGSGGASHALIDDVAAPAIAEAPQRADAAVAAPANYSPPAQGIAPRAVPSYRPSAEDSPLAGVVSEQGPLRCAPALRDILIDARRRGASDLHFMSEEPPRLRIGGYLTAHGSPVSDKQTKELLLPLLNERNRKQFDELGYADFACEIEGAGRLRVNLNKQRSGVKGCFRLIMHDPPTLEALGMPPELRQMLDYHQGLVVVSGPSGAGKTTTLAALVDMFNSEKAVHIITVEDPVELIHPIKKAIVTQREVGAHTKSFHSALKGSLREDPDIIAIGELRDRETVEKALEAAETGHLVFATMSTPNGASTIDRLIDMFPPDDQSQVRATLAGALKFVVSQRLVARADGKGQVAAVELLTGGMALWSLIRDDKLFQLPSLLQRGRGFGMIRVEDSLNALLSEGVITEASARQYADDPRMIGQMSPAAAAAKSAAPDKSARKGGGRGLFSRKGS
jgi:twitching motility protein PilT